MKVRNGFVSNSSSSSFIFPSGDIKEIAHRMLNIVIGDYSEDDDDYVKIASKAVYKQWIVNLRIALKRKDVKEGKIGITMPSCNYDTYMAIDNGNLYVTTCNNHQWNFDMPNREESEEHDIIYGVVRSKCHYNIRNKMIHHYEIYDENDTSKCPKCDGYMGTYVIDLKGNRICGTCYKGKLGPSEAMKAEKLQKDVRNRPINPITSLDLHE